MEDAAEPRAAPVQRAGADLAAALRASAERAPAAPALYFQDAVISYAELDERADRAAAALQRLGLQRGDRVALLTGNSPEFVEALYGALRAGLIAVPVNVGFTAPEVAAVLADAGARVAVVTAPYTGVLDGVAAMLPELEHVLVAGEGAAGGGRERWSGLLERAGAPAPVAVGADEIALLQYTSGTTGKPKGAALTHANLLANHEQVAATPLQVGADDVVLCVLPLFHIYALSLGLAFPLGRGASVLLLERFDPLQSLRAAARHRATVLLGVPAMYIAWTNTPGAADEDLASVRFALSGAAPLPGEALERFTAAFGIALWEGYGLTETSPVLTTGAMSRAQRPGSVGKPVPGVELQLLDEHGEAVAPGDLGEVVVRGANVFGGYWRQPEATAEALSAEAWLHTGDIGYLDDDGELHLVDRSSDLVIVSGFNVYPREVEEVLHRHPKVAEAAVVGAPHPYTGECVKAVVVLRPGERASAEELIAFCARSLARFKVPEVVEFVDALPALPSGKVKRRALREARE